MKKIALIVSMILIFAGATMAQTTPATTPAATTTHLKKDGTADKRYKENKTPPKHLKKDGTADKRYKENKTTPAAGAAKPTTPTTTPKKSK